jgi:hypothetical protein
MRTAAPELTVIMSELEVKAINDTRRACALNHEMRDIDAGSLPDES